MVCHGHTGYAEAGQDIVCAAVSAVVQAAAMGVMQVVGARVCYSTDERRGTLDLSLEEGQSPEVQHDVEILLRTALVSLQDIAASYSQYVKVEVKDYEVH